MIEDFVCEKLKNIENRFEELTNNIAKHNVISNPVEFQKHAKLHSELEKIVLKYREYKRIREDYEKTKNLLSENLDKDMVELVEIELKELENRIQKVEIDLKKLLLGEDSHDEYNVIVEIRAGTGGEEASLFAFDLFRMYSRYAERQAWKIEVLNSNATGLGGFKEIIFSVQGKGVYGKLKLERGVHRVQRIPRTESYGRIHTSAATVAVLPEAKEVDVEIKEDDLKIDTFRASGAGGQHVNKTSSAVRITHIPSGVVVSCQDERSQYQNKEKALRLLRAHLLSKAQQEQQEKITKERRQQVKTGDRSEKIRTYNFPQDRITDHRIGKTIYNLKDLLDGKLDEIIGLLEENEQTEKLIEMKM